MEADMATQKRRRKRRRNPSSTLSLKSTGDYAIGSIPTVLYVPDFISQTEQSQLLHHIYQAPAPNWKFLKNRRLQTGEVWCTRRGYCRRHVSAHQHFSA